MTFLMITHQRHQKNFINNLAVIAANYAPCGSDYFPCWDDYILVANAEGIVSDSRDIQDGIHPVLESHVVGSLVDSLLMVILVVIVGTLLLEVVLVIVFRILIVVDEIAAVAVVPSLLIYWMDVENKKPFERW